jgi:hypothetical protein
MRKVASTFPETDPTAPPWSEARTPQNSPTSPEAPAPGVVAPVAHRTMELRSTKPS